MELIHHAGQRLPVKKKALGVRSTKGLQQKLQMQNDSATGTSKNKERLARMIKAIVVRLACSGTISAERATALINALGVRHA